jgi:hypothetical protein
MTPDKPVRVQLDLPKDRIRELEEIMTRTGVSTRKDVFENALALLEWAVGQAEEGKMIGSVDRDETFQELLMPALVSARKRYGTRRKIKSEEVTT